MVPVGTVVVPLTIGFIEILLAKGINYAREMVNEFVAKRLLTFLWVLGLSFALAMPMFIGGLYYMKIVQMGTDAPIIAGLLIMIGLVLVSFVIHGFPLFIAEAVADATAWFGYYIKQSRCRRAIRGGLAARYRAAIRAETAYRTASNLVERYNSEISDDPIKALALTKVAADLINRIQEGSLDYDMEQPSPDDQPASEAQRGSQAQTATTGRTNREDNDTPPIDPVSNKGRDGEPIGSPNNVAAANANAPGYDKGNNGGGSEPEYWSDIDEAETKDRDGEVS
jgi:hypothetical protein